ncbi:MAG: hypothetical protein WAM39_23635 [Bryobacteraceae bacterium]
MRSSISNSDAGAEAAVHPRTERRVSGRLIFGTITLGLVALGAIEAATRIGFSRISAIESRTAFEHAEALSIRHESAHTSVLLLGNSLLLEDVDMSALRKSLPSRLRVTRFTIESTHFLDWEYGLRRLFADGSRPDLVMLLLGPTHVIATDIRGDYSAFYLFNTSDIMTLSSELHLSRTQISSLYLARYSLFWAGRNNLRNFVLGRAMPAYAGFLHGLAIGGPKPVPDNVATELSRQRLAAARETARAYGAKFVFAIPPGFFASAEQAVIAGANEAGVTVLDPVPNGAWPATLFRDGFHLNRQGAALFTPKLGAALATLN